MLKVTQKGTFIQAPVPTVWNACCDPHSWKDWNQEIQRVDLLETPKAGAIGRIHTNRGDTYQFKITRFSPGTFLEWRREYELGTTLIQSYFIIKNSEGSTLTSTLFCDGKLAKIIAGIMRSRFKRDLERQVAGFQSFCENSKIHGPNNESHIVKSISN